MTSIENALRFLSRVGTRVSDRVENEDVGNEDCVHTGFEGTETLDGGLGSVPWEPFSENNKFVY